MLVVSVFDSSKLVNSPSQRLVEALLVLTKFHPRSGFGFWIS